MRSYALYRPWPHSASCKLSTEPEAADAAIAGAVTDTLLSGDKQLASRSSSRSAIAVKNIGVADKVVATSLSVLMDNIGGPVTSKRCNRWSHRSRTLSSRESKGGRPPSRPL
ncbi:hypothetical protein J6590_023196 [Homalodisca vitripennis]|nr:hypothetical protein J6590_023196 [Homalodisca vitripennis]